jgi:uncharacterized repeat protein (TIGR02543 family)
MIYRKGKRMNILMRKCISAIFIVTIAAIGLYAQTHFSFSSNTGNDLTVIVPVSINPTIDGVALANGDEIGVFTPGGLCVGASIWNGSSNIAIAVHGDNDRTTAVDGIAVGEQLLFRVWDASLSKEGGATATYSSGGPNYSIDGMAFLSALTAVSSQSSYTVSYDGNGNNSGGVPTNSVSYVQGATVTVWGNTASLAKTGVVFSGWNTAANGSGTNYSVGSTFTIGTANIILYAKWAVNSYTITFDKNDTGATGTMNPQTIASGSTTPISLNTFTKAGWTFAGWAATSDGAIAYADGANYTIGSANVTLFAHWTSNPTYMVTYNGNGNSSGTIPADANTYLQNAMATVLGNTGGLAKTGSTFAGWNTAANGSGMSYAAGVTFTIGTANVVLYAQWTTNNFVLTVNQATDQGAPVKIKDTTVTYGDTVRLTAPIVTGCLFVNWRIITGTAVLLDSTKSTCGVILLSGNAGITAFYSSATPVLNTTNKNPTSFSLNEKSGTLTFAIPELSGFSVIPVNIRIFDIQGHKLGCLIDKSMSPGYYSANLRMQGKMAAGIMICRMESVGYINTVKIGTIYVY